MKKYKLIMAITILGCGVTIASCKKDVEEASTASSGLASNNYDLYNRLGGTDMVADPAMGGMIEAGRLTLRSVVDSTIFVIAGDSAFLNSFFPVLVSELGAGNTTGLSELSENLTDFFCVATGSKNASNAYIGLDMKTAHDPSANPRMGMKANDADYTKFVGYVVEGAAQNGVPATDPLVTDLGKLLETLRTTIVQN